MLVLKLIIVVCDYNIKSETMRREYCFLGKVRHSCCSMEFSSLSYKLDYYCP